MTCIHPRRAGLACIVLLSIATCTAALAAPQQAGAKKLYCWNENGRKVCGDALPADAADNARVEFSAKSGRQTAAVDRALTPEEQAAADAAAAQAQADAEAAAARRRRDLAMVESYASEDDLRRAYGERIALLDDALKASQLGEDNLRRSLASLLGQASDLELAGKPVPPNLLANIRTQHAELGRQLRILTRQKADRAGLDDELAEAVERYRALRKPDARPAP